MGALPPRQMLQAALMLGDAATVDAALPLFVPRQLRKDETLLHQGGVWGSAFLIEQGLLRMHFTRRDGKAFNKSFHAEGMVVCPITSAMAQLPSLFAITAVEPSRVWQAPARALQACLAQRGAWEPLRAALMERLLTHKLQREHDLLALDARARYEQFCALAPGLAQRIPLAHLATYLGMTDVSLSRIRRQFKPPAD